MNEDKWKHSTADQIAEELCGFANVQTLRLSTWMFSNDQLCRNCTKLAEHSKSMFELSQAIRVMAIHMFDRRETDPFLFSMFKDIGDLESVDFYEVAKCFEDFIKKP